MFLDIAYQIFSIQKQTLNFKAIEWLTGSLGCVKINVEEITSVWAGFLLYNLNSYKKN